jgi:hypothetical protein
MTRESVEAKANRYLCESRLTVVLVGGDIVRAACRGSGELYELGHTDGLQKLRAGRDQCSASRRDGQPCEAPTTPAR